MDFDFSFMDNEDFGLAKSFSTAPILTLAPGTNFEEKERGDIEHELDQELHTGEYVSEGFCFKLAPGQDVSALTKFLYQHLPSLISDPNP
jgi:hypothetical protein